MRKVVKVTVEEQQRVPYKGLLFDALYFAEGEVDFLGYVLPHHTVFVAKDGTRFLNVGGVEGELDLGWVKLKGTEIPNWKERSLPVYEGIVLDDSIVLLRARVDGWWNKVCIVSARAMEERWDEVRSYLVGEGWADYLVTWPTSGEEFLTLGGDPEFEVICDGEVVPADSLLIFRDGDTYDPIGTDGASHTAELRPDPACSPEEYVENFLGLLEEVKSANVFLSVQGDIYALGGHIHIGSSNGLVVQVLKDEVEKFVQVLDDFVGRVLLPTSGRARGSYARLGAYELKTYGWEYRTPPSSFYADLEMVRITFKLVKGLVETLLQEREISYEVLEDGRAKKEEYLRFLTKEEAEYFLAFPEKWARGEIIPLVPMGNIPPVLFTFRDEWDDDNAWVFKEALKDLPVKRPVRLVLYGLAQRRGDVFAIPTAPEEWRLKEEFPKVPFVWSAIPEVWIGIPYRFRRVEEISETLLEEFVSWVEEYLAQLKLLATQEVAE
ncbi:MAG: putative amidoligase domain-containing protein [Thermocrinis sp.]|jgi:hypothetical protein|uniref:putative amidoligase domain-containing protein n=1 Tax=Thermocrinis sp. TaxID=2024383 RepID=UPI003BFDF9EF